jgi:AcrR family transcriptional regulator
VGTGYKKSEATKERVLKAAYEQFSTYGYHGASLREIATLCGISHPGIRHHFPTKEDLFIEVLRERDSRVRSIVETWIAEKGVSIEGVVEIARQNMTTPGLLELFTITAAQAGNPDHPAHDFFVMRYAERRRLYAKYLRIGQEQGTVRRDIDLEDTASTIVALLDGIAIQWMMGPEDVCLESLLGKAFADIFASPSEANKFAAQKSRD